MMRLKRKNRSIEAWVQNRLYHVEQQFQVININNKVIVK